MPAEHGGWPQARDGDEPADHPVRRRPWAVTKRGARSLFLVDKSIGYRTAGLSAVMHELAPGLYQSRHRHGGEAWLTASPGRATASSTRSATTGGRRPHRRGPLGVASALQCEVGGDRPDHPGAQLRRAVRHDADPPRPVDLFEEPPVLDAPDCQGGRMAGSLRGRPEG